MARFNEILAGRYNRGLQKIFSMKGAAPSPQLGGEIMPTFAMQGGAENYVLQSVEKFGVRLFIAGVAASFSANRLRNPVGSGVVAIFEKISVELNPANERLMFIGTGVTDLTTPVVMGSQRFDARGRNSPTLIASQQALGAVPPNTMYWGGFNTNNVTLDVIATDIQEFPLLPGDFLEVVDTVANVNMSNSFWWRERALESSEVSQ
jgi:hypothetical protein